MTPKCPRRCGRTLPAGKRVCDPCYSRLNASQRARLATGADVSTIINSYDSGTSSYDSSSSDGGGCGGE